MNKDKGFNVNGGVQEVQDADESQRIDLPPDSNEGLPPSKIYKPLSLPVVSLLIPSAILGLLARLGMVALTTYDGNSVFPLLYVQALGCLVMGMGLRLKEPIGEYYGPLYIALTTGFCGSLTTFSTWQLDIFNAWINAGQYKRAGLRDFVDGVGISAITLSISLASLELGSVVASILLPFCSRPRFLPRPARHILTFLSILTYGGTLLTYFFLPANFRHQATAALLFAFPGALARYLLSTSLNYKSKVLPLGTLAANILGTALLATFHVLQSKTNPLSPNACSLLQGLDDGFCGCLTTVSTFAAEIRHLLSKRKAVRYIAVSWLMGQAMMLLIFGTPLWTNHARKQITCSFTE